MIKDNSYIEMRTDEQIQHIDGDLYLRANGDIVMVDGIMGNQFANARGGFKRFFKKVGSKIKSFKPLRKIGLAIPRNAYLGLLSNNFRGHATKMDLIKKGADSGSESDKIKWNKLISVWSKFGGKESAFTRAIRDGAKKKILLNKKYKKQIKGANGDFEELEYELFYTADGVYNYPFDVLNDNYRYAVTAAGVAASMAAATPIIIGTAKIIGDKKAAKDAAKGAAKLEQINANKEIEIAKVNANKGGQSFFAKHKKPILIISGLLFVGGIASYFLLKRKK